MRINIAGSTLTAERLGIEADGSGVGSAVESCEEMWRTNVSHRLPENIQTNYREGN